MTTTRYLHSFVPLLLAISVTPAAAQTQLEEIVVTGTRSEQQLGQVPLAISLVNLRDIQLGRQELSLDESLARVPGLFMQNRYNFTQDLRVSIRGFGSRASFGIRGIKVFADGIPVTLPDGQSGTDDLDIGSAGSIEVIRGPSASLYGTASGGVISLTTEEPPEEPSTEAKLTLGEYGHEKYQIKTGGRSGRLGYLVNASHMKMEGYREHSEVQHSLLNSKFTYDIDDVSTLTAIANAVNSPTANDAGGVTRDDVAEDRRQAQSRNTSSNAGEKFNQQRLGLIYDRQLADGHELTLRTYTMWKDFQTFIPIGSHIPFVGDDGVVEYDRHFFGGGAMYTFTDSVAGLPNVLTIGTDLDIQKDDRQRFINNAGVQGDRVFDQMEEAESLGVYFRNETSLTDTVTLSLGGRYDNLDLTVNDRYLENGDQSGALDFNEFSPAVGLMWNAAPSLNLYTNYATSFETPTFTELGTPAQELDVNLGGFNNVTAQQADSFEIGAKGALMDGRLFYDVAAYTMEVDDEISNIVSIENRAFFENANTDRDGFEAQIQAQLTDRLDLTASYTFSDYTFSEFANEPDAEGQWVPGIPRHQYYAELAYTHPNGAYVIWDALNVGRFYADNANADEVDSYLVSSLRFGNDYEFGNTTVAPFFGINNLFDEEYFSNVRANAFGGRAFEPAPERHVYGGVRIDF
ncbi:MAG: TonB-dependent receptor [Pseudohongiellaceae bacterium]